VRAQRRRPRTDVPRAARRAAQIVDTSEDWVLVSFSSEEEDFWVERESRAIAPFGSLSQRGLADWCDLLLVDKGEWVLASVVDKSDEHVVVQWSAAEPAQAVSRVSSRLAPPGTMTGPKLGLGGGPHDGCDAPAPAKLVLVFERFVQAQGLERAWLGLSHGQVGSAGWCASCSRARRRADTAARTDEPGAGAGAAGGRSGRPPFAEPGHGHGAAAGAVVQAGQGPGQGRRQAV
jgi:hypothetical protein